MYLLNALADQYKLPIIVSTHPRTQKKINEMSPKTNSLIRFLKPFGFLDYVSLQTQAKYRQYAQPVKQTAPSDLVR